MSEIISESVISEPDAIEEAGPNKTPLGLFGPRRSGSESTRTAILRNLPASTGPFVALLVMGLLLSLVSPVFMTVTNLMNIGQQIAILAVLAIGGTAVIMLGGIDLSVGSVLALAGAVIGNLHVNHGMNIWLAALAALLVGLLAGLINGLLIEYGNLPPFIATLAMMTIARGLTLVVLDSRPLSGYPNSFRNLANYRLANAIPASLLIAIGLFLIAWAYFRWRASGRALFAVGANYEVARLSGLAVRRLTISVYAIAGLLAAIGGILMTARLNSASPQAGTGFELDVIAAVVIGGASLTGGYGSIAGTAVGVLIIGVLRNGLNLLNVDSNWQQVIIGLVIAAAVLIENLRQRRAARL